MALDPARHVTQYGHRTWNTQDGYFNAPPQAVTQTMDGYLWVGGTDGLRFFDGVHFLPLGYPESEQLPSENVTALLGAHDGTLWIGTDAGLAHWTGKRLVIFPNVTARVNSILQANDGRIWVTLSRLSQGGAYGPLCSVTGDNATCFGPPGIDASLVNLYCAAIDQDGSVWAGSDTKIFRWRSGSFETFSIPYLQKSSGQTGVSGISVDSAGKIWVGQVPSGRGAGLVQFTKGLEHPISLGGLDVGKVRVETLLLDREGTLWLGTLSDGLYRIKRGKAEHLMRADGLSSNTILNIYEDAQGAIWIATTEGLDNYFDTPVLTYSEREGLSADEVDSVLALRTGQVLVGTADGLNAIRWTADGGVVTSSGPPTQVTSLLEDRQSRLWIGYNDDLFLRTAGRLRRVQGFHEQTLGLVTGLAADDSGNVWAAVRRSEMRTLLRVRVAPVVEISEEPQTPLARTLASASDGSLWMGLMDGDIARYKGGTSTTYHYPHHHSSPVRQIDVVADGSILASTIDGLLGWRLGAQRIMSVREGLPCDDVRAFVFDLFGDLWLSTTCGLIEIAPDALDRWWTHPGDQVNFKLLGAADGVKPGYAPFQAAARSVDGRLWFANGTVLQMIDPEHLQANSPSPVHIEILIADRKRYAATSGLELPSHTRDIQIDYTALNLSDPGKVRFRYRLQGHDADWHEAGGRRQAFYNDLSPGAYRFQVITRNGAGDWSPIGEILAFRIHPALYQQVWFQVLEAFFCVGALWLAYFARVRQETEKVQLRLSERLVERERIARELHDTLLQGFQGLLLLIQGVQRHLHQPEIARNMLERALDQGDEVLLEGRSRVRDLRSGGTSNTDELGKEVSTFGNQLLKGSCMEFELVIVGHTRTLPLLCREEVISIAREGIYNAFQHSQGSKIEVEIAYETKSLRLQIRDNGCGIDDEVLASGRANHFGLAGMRERAHLIGAELNLWSTKGGGTELELTIPASKAYRRPAAR